MKEIAIILFVTIIISQLFQSCTKDKDTSETNQTISNQEIIYKSVKKEYVLQKSVQSILNSNDEISNHIDSVINGTSYTDIISTGEKSFNLDGDTILDISFDIIDLNLYNTNLPDTLDSLAARVHPLNIELLDNSTWGYIDALTFNKKINHEGYWDKHENNILGTFLNIGEFQGQGYRYLAFRLLSGNNYKYGWVKLYCSQHNDTLLVDSYAYNNIENGSIKSGQTE